MPEQEIVRHSIRILRFILQHKWHVRDGLQAPSCILCIYTSICKLWKDIISFFTIPFRVHVPYRSIYNRRRPYATRGTVAPHPDIAYLPFPLRAAHLFPAQHRSIVNIECAIKFKARWRRRWRRRRYEPARGLLCTNRALQGIVQGSVL